MRNTFVRNWGRPRFAVGVATATVLAMLVFANAPVSAQPAAPGVPACPLLSLANPGPGDMVPNGDYVVSGIALDPITRSPSGVSRIDFFLGFRDDGGSFLGSTTPGTDPNIPAGFRATVTLPDGNRLDTFTAYAYAANSGATTIVAVPIQIGSPPRTTAPATPTPVTASATIKFGCVAVSVSAAGVAVGTSTAPMVAVRATHGPVLQLGNPNPGDVISRGDYVSSGVAFDPASQGGPGVDRVDFFLDARDSGGLFLGSATPGLAGGPLGAFARKVTLPGTASGGHNFVAYAHSSVSGLESAVAVPVFVGVSVTPTPRP
jgi:hypothetical protein